MTEQDKSLTLSHSNVGIFYDIARSSIERMNCLIESGRSPKPNGEPGWIVTFDPDQKSFKEALIVIAFSGVFLEALLHLLIVEKHGINIYRKYDRKKYEEKLMLLKCTDPRIIEECKHYRTVRREIVHEKAHLDLGEIRWAQKEAARTFSFIESVNVYFGNYANT